MSLSTKLRKNELRLIAEELGLTIPVNVKVIGLRELIEDSIVFQTNPDVVEGVIEEVLASERERRESEAENLRIAKLKLELDLENVRRDPTNTSQDREVLDYNSSRDNLESLIKSVKTLTISVPSRSVSFHIFFQSLEKAFKTKSVPNDFKSEILLNLSGEKISNILVYFSQEDLFDYEKIKELVLKEYEPTPKNVLQNLKKLKSNLQKLLCSLRLV